MPASGRLPRVVPLLRYHHRFCLSILVVVGQRQYHTTYVYVTGLPPIPSAKLSCEKRVMKSFSRTTRMKWNILCEGYRSESTGSSIYHTTNGSSMACFGLNFLNSFNRGPPTNALLWNARSGLWWGRWEGMSCLSLSLRGFCFAGWCLAATTTNPFCPATKLSYFWMNSPQVFCSQGAPM